MENVYETLVSALRESEITLVVTKLAGKKGRIHSDLRRSLIKFRQDTELKEVVSEGWEGKAQLMSKKDSMAYVEPFFPRERLIVLGGGHIALPLVRMAKEVGFNVVVVDDRPSFANGSRFPEADQVVCEDFTNYLSSIKMTTSDYVVIVTRGHRYDTACLKGVLEKEEPAYVGMIGSKRRVTAVKQDLLEKGYDKERLAKVCTPIGLDIGAVTPAEISIAIVAELIQYRRSKLKKGNMTSDGDLEVIEVLANRQKEACSIVTIIDAKGSVPRGVGAKMIVYPTGQIVGSIGGGCSEAAVIHEAIHMIGTGEYKVQTVDLTASMAEEEGMVCGGKMEVLIEDYAL